MVETSAMSCGCVDPRNRGDFFDHDRRKWDENYREPSDDALLCDVCGTITVASIVDKERQWKCLNCGNTMSTSPQVKPPEITTHTGTPLPHGNPIVPTHTGTPLEGPPHDPRPTQ